MDNMISFTVVATIMQNDSPTIAVGSGPTGAGFRPKNPQNNSYWIAIIDRNDPKKLVQEFLIPGQNHSTVPAGLDAAMGNVNNLFVIATQNLSTLSVPQGELYDFFVKYGSGRELDRLEQINVVLNCGRFGNMSYVMIGSGGPRGGNNIPTPSLEYASIFNPPPITISLMGRKGGGGPYSPCDNPSFQRR